MEPLICSKLLRKLNRETEVVEREGYKKESRYAYGHSDFWILVQEQSSADTYSMKK